MCNGKIYNIYFIYVKKKMKKIIPILIGIILGINHGA